MANYADPTPKTNVGSLFVAQLTRLKQHNQDEEKSILNEQNSQWYRPVDFDAALHDIEAYHEPFSRKQQEDEFIESTTKPDAAGTTGDLTMVEVQGDWLHVMERAYRARNFSSVRSRVQAGGRKMGHGHDQGVIKEGLIGYVVNVDRLNKGEEI
jgi:hypothetical protein